MMSVIRKMIDVTKSSAPPTFLYGSVQGSVQSLQDGNKPQQDPHQLDWDQHPITIDPSLLDTKIGEGLPPLISGPTTILGEGRDARLKRVLESDKGKI